MYKSFVKIAIAAFCGLWAVGCSHAMRKSELHSHPIHVPVGAHLTDGAMAIGPSAASVFCDNYPDQCLSKGQSAPLPLDAERWQDMVEVNLAVNRSIRPRREAVGTDVWELDVTSGDCDEFALKKRSELLSRGWPSAALLLAVAYVANGDAHLVLTVRTDRGDFVLDNLRSRVLAAEHTGYRWLMRQSTLHPRLWVQVDGVRHDKTQVAKLTKTGKKKVEPVSAKINTMERVVTVDVDVALSRTDEARDASSAMKSVPPVDFTAMQDRALLTPGRVIVLASL